MPRKKTGKKVYRRSRSGVSKKLLLFFVLIISLFSIFITVNQLQKNQTITQHAETKMSIITEPVWGCLGLGSSDICTTTDNTFVSDPINAECVSVDATLDPKEVEQGQEITAKFTITNKCNAGKPIPQMTFKAKHSGGTQIEFTDKSDAKTLPKGTLEFTTKYTVTPNDAVGDWSATLWEPGVNNSERPVATQSSNIKFTILPPCEGLEVVPEKDIAVDKGHVNINESIKATITYRNPCERDYKVGELLIQVKKPGTGNSSTLDDFGNARILNYTFKAKEEKTVEGTLTVLDKQGTLTVHPCGLNQPTCTWSAIGSYKKVTANGWIVNPKEAPFTVGAMDPVDVAKLTQGAGTPQENITRVPAGGTCDPSGKTNKCADGYICPQKAEGGKNTCVQQIPANGICDPKEGNLCVSGYSCQKDASSATGNKCLADKTTSPAPGASKAPAKPVAKLTQQIVYFDFNSSAVKSDYTADLQRVIDYMKANPTAKVTLEGHTDNVGDEAYNKDLGMQRAQSVRTYLVGKGIAATRFTVISKGEKEPLTPNKTAVDRYRNRRVEIF